jgi:REP element-mobilizing transposase RayT
LVFVTKYRRGVLDADMLRSCQDAMRKVCDDFGAELREFSGEDDHVHLLVEYPPKVAVSALVNSLKGVSARRLRAEFTGREPAYHARPFLVPVVLRRVLPERSAEHHPEIHRAAKAPG